MVFPNFQMSLSTLDMLFCLCYQCIITLDPQLSFSLYPSPLPSKTNHKKEDKNKKENKVVDLEELVGTGPTLVKGLSGAFPSLQRANYKVVRRGVTGWYLMKVILRKAVYH